MDKQPFGLGDKGDAQHPQVTLSRLGTVPPPAHPEAGPVLLPPSRARSAAGRGAMPVPGAVLSCDSAPGCSPKWRRLGTGQRGSKGCSGGKR